MFSDSTKTTMGLNDALKSLDTANQVGQIKSVGNQSRPSNQSPNFIAQTNARSLSTPTHVTNVGAKVTNTSDVSSKVTVSFQRDPSDYFFSKAIVYVSGYKGNPAPVQVASGDSPVSFALENTGEAVSIAVQAHGNLGPAPLQTAPNTTLKLRSTSLATVSTTAGNGPAALKLETNGTPNGSQSLLNLKGANGSIILTDDGVGDVSLQGLTFGTSGQGWLWTMPPNVTISASTSWNNGVANTVMAVQIQIFATYTFRKVVVSEGALVAGNASCAIYDITGNTKLLDAGANAFNTATSGVQVVTLASPVTLGPGVYWFAASATPATATAATSFAYTGGAAGQISYINNGTVRAGIAANAMSSGAMPSTLGAVTNAGNGITSFPVVLLTV